METDVRKIIVIGCPGSGKSTFSKKLHNLTGIPLYHLDMMYWNADRTIVEKAVFRKRLEDALGQEAWIIDGNYASTMEMRLQACDTVIFLDYAVEVCLEGVKARRGNVRTDMPWVETVDEEDEEFLGFIKSYNSDSRPAVLELLEKYKDKNIVIFRSRGEAEEFLKQMVLAVTLSKNNATVERVIPDWMDMTRQGNWKALVEDMAVKMYSDAYVKRYRPFLPLLTLLQKPKDVKRFLTLAKACLTCEAYAELDKIKCPVNNKTRSGEDCKL